MPIARRGLRTVFTDFVEGEIVTHGRIVSRDTSNTDSTRIWIIIASVAGVLAIGACIGLVAMSISRRRLQKQLLDEARQRDPFLGEKDFSKKRKKPWNVLECEAESQRDAMIRKSLASRSGRSMSSTSQLISDTMSMDERPNSSCTQEYRLRDEEDYERSYTRSRSGTVLSDKSWEGGVSSRSRSPFPDLPARTWSRSSSPSRRADLPPLLEQHPLFRNASTNMDSEIGRNGRGVS